MLTQLILSNALAIPIQDDGGIIGSLFGLALLCPSIIVLGLLIAGLWKIFTKADEKGWAAIIPFYNWWVLLRIVGRPGWWFILLLIPFVNFIVGIILMFDLAKSFDKSPWWGLGLVILPWLMTLVLGFGDAQYYGPSAGNP
jgi:hypothetical protein